MPLHKLRPLSSLIDICDSWAGDCANELTMMEGFRVEEVLNLAFLM